MTPQPTPQDRVPTRVRMTTGTANALELVRIHRAEAHLTDKQIEAIEGWPEGAIYFMETLERHIAEKHRPTWWRFGWLRLLVD